MPIVVNVTRIVECLAVGLTVLIVLSPAGILDAADDAEFVDLVWTDDGAMHTDCGRIVTEAADGGILFETPDGRLRTIVPGDIERRTPAAEPCLPDRDAMAASLVEEFGAEFSVRAAGPYLLCSDAGEAFDDWVAGLVERLHRGFETYWTRTGIELHAARFPLPIIIFRDRNAFSAYATADAGVPLGDAAGYYSVMTNRVALYDLSSDGGAPAATRSDVERKVAAVPFLVATVVHEATHQLAFNSGLQRRLADNPLWLTEGLAMYFEAPDLRNRTGWRTIGQIHTGRLRQFRQSLASRPQDAFAELLSDNRRLTDPTIAVAGYAESWALTHFLLTRKKRQMTEYLQVISAKPPLIWDTPETRLAEFEAAFGKWERLEAEFLSHTQRLRLR